MQGDRMYLAVQHALRGAPWELHLLLACERVKLSRRTQVGHSQRRPGRTSGHGDEVVPSVAWRVREHTRVGCAGGVGGAGVGGVSNGGIGGGSGSGFGGSCSLNLFVVPSR